MKNKLGFLIATIIGIALSSSAFALTPKTDKNVTETNKVTTTKVVKGKHTSLNDRMKMLKGKTLVKHTVCKKTGKGKLSCMSKMKLKPRST